MRILLTNDDGIYAPGLRALLPELRKLGEVVVVAPATEQSAVGHSVTLTDAADRAGGPGRGTAAAGLGGGRPAGRLREAGAARTAAGAARPDRQRPQRRLQRGHQRALFGHRGGRHRGGLLPRHQHRLLAGIQQADAARLRPRRRAGPARRRADPGPPARRRHRCSMSTFPTSKRPAARHPRRAAERRRLSRRPTTAAPTRAAGSTSGRTRNSAAPTRTPTPT